MTLHEMAEAYERWLADKQARETNARIAALLRDMNGRYAANQPEYVGYDGELMPLKEFQRRMGWLG